MASVNGNGYHGANGAASLPPHDRPLRHPPHNDEAERSVLGSILIDNEVLPAIAELLAAPDFYRDDNQIIYRAILALHARGVPVDGVTLADELERRGELEGVGGVETLAELVNSVPHSVNAVYHAGIVREKSIVRKLAQRATLVLESTYANDRTSAELIELAHTGLAEVGEPAHTDDGFALRPWPDAPDPSVWYGLAGDIVRKIAPETEADPIAVLVQLLVGFGNIIGRKAHWRVDASRHACNLFVCICGNSSKARKGTSWDVVRYLLKGCDEDWAQHRVLGGLATGEGLIWQVRDKIMKRGDGGQEYLFDPGIDDKRALWVENEFGTTLAVLNWDKNTLSGYLRKAWDCGDIASAVKNNPSRTTGAHISVIGHITVEELHRRLTATDAANGFANRFLWVCARRARLLPEGGRITALKWTDEQNALRDAVMYATRADEDDYSFVLTKAPDTKALWAEVYEGLSEPKAGLFGSVISRAEAQVMRLAAIYALLDRSTLIRREHLQAALGLWKYCEQSAAYLFGESMGVPNADRVLAALDASPDGLSKGDILRKVFHGRQPREPIGGVDEILGSLRRAGLAEFHQMPTRGRPSTIWKRVQKQESAT